MKPIEVLNLLWYIWKRKSWMLDRNPRLDAKWLQRAGQNYCSTLLMCRFDLP